MVNLSLRYAKSLWNVVQNHDGHTQDEIIKNLSLLQNWQQESIFFKRFLNDPLLGDTDLLRVMKIITNKSLLNKYLSNLLLVLAKLKHLYLLENIIKEYHNIHYHNNGIIIAKLETSNKVSNQFIDKITIALKKKLSNQVLVKIKINKHLVGGFRITIGSKIFDYSSIGRLDKILQTLKV